MFTPDRVVPRLDEETVDASSSGALIGGGSRDMMIDIDNRKSLGKTTTASTGKGETPEK
jgi:hypothetical protein